MSVDTVIVTLRKRYFGGRPPLRVNPELCQFFDEVQDRFFGGRPVPRGVVPKDNPPVTMSVAFKDEASFKLSYAEQALQALKARLPKDLATIVGDQRKRNETTPRRPAAPRKKTKRAKKRGRK